MNRLRRRSTAFVACLLLLSGCGSGPTQHARSAESTEDAAASLSELLERMYGSREQRRAGYLVQSHRLQDPLADCMEDAGVKYPTPGFIDFSLANEAQVTLYDDWLRPPGHLPIVSNAEGLATAKAQRSNDVVSELSTAAKRGYSKALSLCKRAPQSYEDAHMATALLAVDGALSTLAAKVDVGTLAKEYSSCMQDRGFAVSTYTELYEEVSAAAAAQGVRAPAPQQEASPAWQAVRALSGRASQADDACRQDAHAEALRQFSPMMSQWKLDHAGVLTTIDQQWASIEAEAATYQ